MASLSAPASNLKTACSCRRARISTIWLASALALVDFYNR
uniref:MFS domain-containing protein n=1 Tax=Macrostomum lignano TaxID=282301 RepID=A0A1I8F8S4_9PLAT